jgi:hypothetical protein
MLVVIGIIDSRGDQFASHERDWAGERDGGGNRQILDDLAFARLRAISERSDGLRRVRSDERGALLSGNQIRPEDLRLVSNLASRVYASYALLSTRSVGDQPGQSTPRYLTEWKALPRDSDSTREVRRDLSAPARSATRSIMGRCHFPKPGALARRFLYRLQLARTAYFRPG